MVKNLAFYFLITLSFYTEACSEATNVTDSVGKEENDTIVVSSKTEDINRLYSMNIAIGDRILTATLVDNSTVAALKDALANAPLTIEMRDYGNMEKVGSLGQDFPRNDEPVNTEAGDIILYQGNALVIYYAPNS